MSILQRYTSTIKCCTLVEIPLSYDKTYSMAIILHKMLMNISGITPKTLGQSWQ